MLVHTHERGRSPPRRGLTHPHPNTPILHRSLSETFIPGIPKAANQATTSNAYDSRNPDTLRLAVLRNEHRRGSSRATVDIGRTNFHINQPNKNIPMLVEPSRPMAWNSFALNEPKEKPLNPQNKGQKLNIKWSVSPLTKVEKAAIDFAPTPDSARSLQNSMESTENRFEDLNRLYPSLRSPKSKLDFSSNLTKSITHDSMESLSQHSGSSGEEDDVAHHGMENSDDRLSMSDDETSIDIEAPVSVLDFMKDIAQSLSKAIISHDSSRNNYFGNTRIQQKTMALKNLMPEEIADSPVPQFANLFDYATKIQNEALLAEWNQIRQRFSSFVSSTSQKTITCQAGVLGSIIRCEENNFYQNEEVYHISADQKDMYIHKLWYGDPLEVNEPISEPMEIAPVSSPGNYSLMAKNVMLTRKPIEFER